MTRRYIISIFHLLTQAVDESSMMMVSFQLALIVQASFRENGKNRQTLRH